MKKISLLLFSVLYVFTVLASPSERIMLSGTGFGDTVQWDFYCTGGRNSGVWGKINVPSQWELEGYGEFTYGRWYKNKGEQPSKEEGIYKHNFYVPEQWKGTIVRIVFEGVMTDTEVYVNGRLAGDKHQGGFYRFSYDIADLLKYGKENQLEVRVSKHSSNNSVNNAERKADWWLFGGIYRPVYIESLPKVSIDRIAVNARQDGSLDAVIYTNGKTAGFTLRAALTASAGDPNPPDFQEVILEKGNGKHLVKYKWENIDKWNPEQPALYDLVLDLVDKKGNILHTYSERIGFRTVEFRRDDGIYVNDVKIVMKGINRHSFWPDGGRTTNRQISHDDVRLIKEMNMNAVRVHYPPDKHFLEMCDSMGLFVIDELAGWQNAYDTSVGLRLLTEMIDRDVNHPSVILWSNGNEGGWNTELDGVFSMLDPQKRHVIHPWADFDGIDTHHYPAYQTGVARFTNGHKVFMPTEFMHGCYDQGHGAGLEDFWNKYTESPFFAGGFLWDFSDNAVRRDDMGGVLDTQGELAADGILGPYREKEGSYYTVREVWSPVQIRPFNITPSFKGDIFVTNDYLFKSLGGYLLDWAVVKTCTPLSGTPTGELIANGKTYLHGIAPGETKKISLLGLTDSGVFFEGDVFFLTARDRSGREICRWYWPIKTAKQYWEYYLGEKEPWGVVHYDEKLEDGSLAQLSANGVDVRFDATTGMIEEVRNSKGVVGFGNGPVPEGMTAEFISFNKRRHNGQVSLIARYKGAIDSIVWTLTDEGLLKMDALMLNRANGGGGFDDAFVEDQILNFGFSFDYPEQNVKGMQWFGRGPYRVWKNRIKGTNFGLWYKDWNNTMTGASFPLVYPEFKGYHANTYWATIKSKVSDFTVYSESDGLFLRMYTPEEPEASDDRALPEFPSGDISFLYDIPGMRCFKPLEQHGPSAQPGSVRIKKGDEGIRMVLWFDFR